MTLHWFAAIWGCFSFRAWFKRCNCWL